MMTEPSFDATPSDMETSSPGSMTGAPGGNSPLKEEPLWEPSLTLEPDPHTPAQARRSLPTRMIPPVRMSLGYRTTFFLASMVGGLSSVCIKQLLLPIQVSQLDPRTTATSFAVVASVGACAGLIASPLSGALSDRTASRWGRRRPWIILGILIAVGGLLTMAGATSIPVLLVGEVLAQVGVDTILATVTALIPDQIPEHQRSGPSALNGMAPIVGGVLGLVLVTSFTTTRQLWQGYGLLAGVSALFILIFLLILRERPISCQDVPPFHWRSFLAGFSQPLGSRDFTCTFLSRALAFLSFTLLGAYLFFYLSQGLHVSLTMAAQTVTTFQVLSTVSLTLAAVLAGWLAHRFQRLKPCIIAGALVMATGVLLMVAVPTTAVLPGAAILFGSGFGGVLGVDIALAIRVLPKATDRGKDLGLISTAIFLPLIISPVIGAAILNTIHSFPALFLVAALASVLAALMVLPIKSVR